MRRDVRALIAFVMTLIVGFPIYLFLLFLAADIARLVESGGWRLGLIVTLVIAAVMAHREWMSRP